MHVSDFTNCQPPAYDSLPRQPTAIHRPTASGISTISGQATTTNAFLVAIPSGSMSASNTPMELSPTMLAEKRLRVGLNAVRHASLTTQANLSSVHNSRPITSLRTRALSTNQQRPFTTHTNSRYLPHLVPTLPGQITESGSTHSLNERSGSDSEKTGQ